MQDIEFNPKYCKNMQRIFQNAGNFRAACKGIADNKSLVVKSFDKSWTIQCNVSS